MKPKSDAALTNDRIAALVLSHGNDWLAFARAVEAEATAELHADNERLRALLREAQDRSVYLGAPATDDHSIPLRERIDAALAGGKE